jgi:nicotinamide mononucleotide transporter
MNEIISFLNNINFNWNIIEIIAVALSIIYVSLASRQNINCWIFAIVSVSLYIYICFNAQLFPETGLQIFYLIMAVYGYLNWSKSSNNLIITNLSVGKHLLIISLGTLFAFLFGYFFTIYTSSKLPIIDSFTTVFSVIATFMLTKKILENWLYWVVIDIVSVYLYFSRELHLTSLLFILYSIIAIFGYLSWLRNSKKYA